MAGTGAAFLPSLLVLMALESPYAVLGVPRTASKQAIKQAFRTLCTKLHPDKGGDLGCLLHLAVT